MSGVEWGKRKRMETIGHFYHHHKKKHTLKEQLHFWNDKIDDKTMPAVILAPLPKHFFKGTHLRVAHSFKDVLHNIHEAYKWKNVEPAGYNSKKKITWANTGTKW